MLLSCENVSLHATSNGGREPLRETYCKSLGWGNTEPMHDVFLENSEGEELERHSLRKEAERR
jgi:hypothetical protein